jgi:hypothetical protein
LARWLAVFNGGEGGDESETTDEMAAVGGTAPFTGDEFKRVKSKK